MRVRKNVDVEVDIDIDLDDFDTDDLIEELERQGYVVTHKGNGDTPADFEDRIHTLKEDFINWYQFGMKNENFEKVMKKFFLDTIDEYIG